METMAQRDKAYSYDQSSQEFFPVRILHHFAATRRRNAMIRGIASKRANLVKELQTLKRRLASRGSELETGNKSTSNQESVPHSLKHAPANP
jgi:hypothetical protein